VRARRWYGPDAALLCARFGTDDAAIAITLAAEALLDEVGLSEPPFDPKIVASFAGIAGVRSAPMSGAGRLVPEGDQLIVEVNGEHSAGKQNFTIAHEVTHTLLPTYGWGIVSDDFTGTFVGTEEEVLADLGASALLLDRRRLVPILLDAAPELATVMEASHLFGASLQATALAVARVAPWPCAIVFWEPGYRKGQAPAAGQAMLPGTEDYGRPAPVPRIAAAYASASFGPYLPINKSAAADSLVARCFTTRGPTWGTDVLDIGRSSLSVYAENAYVPYRTGAAVRPRVISLLRPMSAGQGTRPQQLAYATEVL